jgi:hypothetical protein
VTVLQFTLVCPLRQHRPDPPPLYVWVSTSDRSQSVENQLQPLQETAGPLGWSIAAIYRDERINGANGCHSRPGLDALSWRHGAPADWDDRCLTRSGCSVSDRTRIRHDLISAARMQPIDGRPGPRNESVSRTQCSSATNAQAMRAQCLNRTDWHGAWAAPR